MRSRALAVVGALAVMVAALVGGQLVSAGPAAAEPGHCSTNVGPHPDYYRSGHIGFKDSGYGTAIRDHPYADCDLRAQVFGGHINVYCGKVNTNKVLWLYVKDKNIRTAGWVRWNNMHYSLPYTANGERFTAVGGTRCGGGGWWSVFWVEGMLYQNWGRWP
jgi:hypothetical protein